MATDTDMQLSDMLESYPSSMTKGFQTLITAKKEFQELASDPFERLPSGRGKYYKHQTATHRYLRIYDDLVVISEAGSGKSCEVLGFTEYTRRELAQAKIDPLLADEKAAHFRRVIVLVKGPTQRNEFRSQLTCKCSDGHYVTDLVREAKTESVQKSNLTLEIKKAGYTVTTYTSFAHKIARDYPTEADNDRLAQDFADTIFWIDEGHNLLIDPEDTTAFREKQQTYHTIWRVLHLAVRSKRIISTATPMINENKEIGSLMNLILPLDGVLPPNYDYRSAPESDIRLFFPGLPFDHRTATPDEIAPYFRGQFPIDFDYDRATLADYEPYFRGRVAYIRALDTGAVIQNEGAIAARTFEVDNVTYESQTVLYSQYMSEFQSEVYMRAKHAGHGRDELFNAERQASNFAFPDGYWGNGTTEEEREIRREVRKAKAAAKAVTAAVIAKPMAKPVTLPPMQTGVIQLAPTLEAAEGAEIERHGFRRYVTLRGDSFEPADNFGAWLTNLETIRELSCKFAEIVRIVSTEPGNAFVYGEFVEGSGAIVLALCLEGLGFQRYTESTSMFQGLGAAVKPICGGGETETVARRVRGDILSHSQGAPFRYALLTRETSDAKFQSMMEAMNSYENRHGDYIKVLISSRVGRDGINVSNVLQIHLMGPEWNQSNMYQAMSRGVRATSHDDLIQEERERLIAAGEDPDTARVTVKVYKHAAFALDEAASSVDLKMYMDAEIKDRYTKRILHIMKQCAVGCQINYQRNVRPGDVNGSPACDYDICEYQCVDPAPTEIDYSTYDVLYANEVVDEASDAIVNLYRQYNALSLDAIAALLPQFRRKYLIMALEKFINYKTPMTDRFGYTVYLREDNGAFYLDRTYPTDTQASYAMSYYTHGIIGIQENTLSDVVVKHETGEYEIIMAELEHVDPTDPVFNARLDNLSIEGQAAILEKAVLDSMSGRKTQFTDAIIHKYQNMIFEIHDPETELEKVYKEAAELKPRKGRKPKADVKRRVKNIKARTIDETKFVRDETTELVYIHILYSQAMDQTAYAVTARFNKGEGRTRILKPSEMQDGWRDVSAIELPVYNFFIQLEIANRKRPYEAVGIYGLILPDKLFRLIDKTTESPDAATDVRHINRGKVCPTWYRPDLIDVMWRIQVEEPGGAFRTFQEADKPALIQWLIQKRVNKPPEELATWDLAQLMYYYKWYEAKKITRVTMCQLIEQRMREMNLILT